jgi:hypothetical protein
MPGQEVAGRRLGNRLVDIARGRYELQDVGDGVVRIGEPHVGELLRADLWW